MGVTHMQECMHRQPPLCIQAAYNLKKHLDRLGHQHGRILNTLRDSRECRVETEPLAAPTARAEMHMISHERIMHLKASNMTPQ